jgi:hypothetical protein
LKFIFFDDLFQTVIHIFLANHQEDGADERTGLEFIEGVSKDGFSPQEVELFLLPFHEAMALSSGDDHCVGFHLFSIPVPFSMLIPLFPFRKGRR